MEQLPWWQLQRDTLLQLTTNTCTPLFVYSLAQLDKSIDALLTVTALDHIFYSVKANHHPDLLRRIESRSFGFECVSIDEVNHIFQLFPDIDPHRILFTPNFAPQLDYAEALRRNVYVTIDSSYPLRHWSHLFDQQQRELIIRVDLGVGKGHHRHVQTAGIDSKFGADEEEFREIIQLAIELNVTIIGVHSHAGSGILDAEHWCTTARQLIAYRPQLTDMRIINIGGGIGIGQTADDGVNLGWLNEQLLSIRTNASSQHVDMWMECGRFLVAKAGVLLARVTQIRRKNNRVYMGIDVGMNTLIRPALYGARHTIHNLSRIDDRQLTSMEVVGPICESADTFGSWPMPTASCEGDTVIICDCGAYGRSMSLCSYNMRAPADEMVLT